MSSPTVPDVWPTPFADSPIDATVTVPGSKSETNRALVLAALSDAPSVISGVLRSRDSDLMIAGLKALGVGFSEGSPDVVRVTPPTTGFTSAPHGIDVGLAGTVMRFLPPVAVLAPGVTRFFGDERASARPLSPLLNALGQLGASIDSPSGSVPFTLTAPRWATSGQANAIPETATLFSPQPCGDCTSKPEVSIDASASSQFVSGLLLAASRYPQGIDLRHVGAAVPSLPHIKMTITMAVRRGAVIHNPETNRWIVEPRVLHGLDETVEPDLTNAAAFLVAAAITSGRVCMYWPTETTQPGDQILDILRRFGADVVADPASSSVVVSSSGQLRGCDVDLRAASELTPVVAGLAAFAAGETRITGVGHIRGHETDRIAAIVATIRAVGLDAQESTDGVVIAGMPVSGTAAGDRPIRTAALSTPASHRGSQNDGGQNGGSQGSGSQICLDTFADHRIAHLGALLGLRIRGINLINVATTAKTMPDFPQRWREMVTGR